MITATFKGSAALKLKLAAMAAEAPKIIADALMEAAKPIQEEAQLRAPVRSGALKATIAVRPMETDDALHPAVAIGPGEKQWYGIFPEYGTSHMAARPFLRPALDSRSDDALKVFKRELARKIR